MTRVHTFRRRAVLFLSLLTIIAGSVWAAEREWQGSDGKLKLKAKFLEVDKDKAVLLTDEKKIIRVDLEKLSDEDRRFIEEQQAEAQPFDPKEAEKKIVEKAEQFYSDLRTTDREIALGLMTPQAQALIKGKDSPLARLPSPAKGSRAIRPGKLDIEGKVAEIHVRVRAGRQYHKTRLHLRYEDDDWQVFAISASYPDGERAINFEAEAITEKEGSTLASLVGQPLELSGTTLNGTPLNMSDYEGKVVLVDFWATWCGPCREEMPNVLQTYNKYHGEGFDVIAVSVDRDMKALQTFVQKQQPPWTVVADRAPGNQNTMGGKYGVSSIPTFVLIGRDGKVATINCRGRRLEGAVVQALKARTN